ncbi:MAG: hypothetical protein ACYCYE_06085 [Clostridia bacterium]|nr:hypothetical protein [Peptococcaceae bacterium]
MADAPFSYVPGKEAVCFIDIIGQAAFLCSNNFIVNTYKTENILVLFKLSTGLFLCLF